MKKKIIVINIIDTKDNVNNSNSINECILKFPPK